MSAAAEVEGAAQEGLEGGARPSLSAVLGDEGFRLFFPLGAVYAALWPLQWVLVFAFDLPFARGTPPALWHAHEMIFGAFGAALIGFLTTAVPEWTDTPKVQGRALYAVAALWGGGRLVGFLGADPLNLPGALLDLAWLLWLAAYLARVSLLRRTDNLVAFLLWIVALGVAEAVARAAFHFGAVELAGRALTVAGYLFMGLLGLALARIGVRVTNLVLDPSEATTPFRPHPGRLNLASGLVAVAVAGELAGLSPAVCGFLLVAAGAAFMDRVGEAFVGREALRSEILVLAGSSLLAGAGLLVAGAERLGAPLPPSAGLHIAFMGGLGLGVLAVFSIAGLLHAGKVLRFSRRTAVAFALLVVAVALRTLPELGLMPYPPGPPHALAALSWAGAFLLWLAAYWPILADPRTLEGGDGPLACHGGRAAAATADQVGMTVEA